VGPVHGHQVGPRPGAAALRHGEAEPLGQVLARPDDGSRPHAGYGYLFGKTECPLDYDTVDELAELMRARRNTSTGTPYIPAGYTYLGQFIDHDITFDASSHRTLATLPDKLENFRTPRLDLDSLYGSGPVVHPFLYDWEHPETGGARLLVGRNPVGGHPDLPRNLPGRALIGDARNDENAIVAQLHLLFINFHNAVIARLAGRHRPWEELFDEARKTVRWHYQWIVVHDFLPTILGPRLATDLVGDAARPLAADERLEFVPLEFSVGAFRFGHSLVRSQYVLKRDAKNPPPPLRIFPDLEGLRPLSADLVLDWTRFFRFERLGYAYQPQNGMQIDSGLSGPLFALPDGGGSLAQRNLRRAARYLVPSGQEVAARLGLPPLDDAALRLDELRKPARERLLRCTPLWYYVLCEAERGGGDHLGPLGGRIVADVILRLLHSDPGSYVHQEHWRPTLVDGKDDFSMTDLIKVAQAQEG
jgi:Animal haem peroxidase